jgi:hypothetical protein
MLLPILGCARALICLCLGNKSTYQTEVVYMRNFFKIFFSFIFICGFSYGHSDDQWNEYQQTVLSEKPNFSGWCPVEKAKQIMNILHSHPSDICVELGVFGGSSFFPIVATLAYKQQGMAYAIDPWENAPCLEGNEHWKEQNNGYWEKIDLNKVMNKFIASMNRNGLDNYYTIKRMISQQAYSDFEDESIDFLHIDGNHSEGASLFDVTHWLPKVKKGGVICFDDAWWASTKKAVQLLLQDCDLMEESSPKWQYIFVQKR